MKLEYVQFYYNDYNNKSINIPDNSLIFKMENAGLQFRYKEKNTWSYDIIILSNKALDDFDSICLGDWYISILYSVYSDYNFNDFKDFPKIEFYIIYNNFNYVDLNLSIDQIKKESIYKISKFKGIDSYNFYFSFSAIKNSVNGEDAYLIGCENFNIREAIRYNNVIVYGEYYANLYKEFVNKVLKEIM